MCHVSVTTTATTPLVTVVCSSASLITTAFMMAPTSVGLTTLGLHDVVLSPQLIQRDTMTGSVGLTTLPQQQQTQSQVPSQVYANYAVGPQQASFFFQS